MREIKLYIDNDEISFAVNNYKILFGENYIKKYKIFNKIEKYFKTKNDDEVNTDDVFLEGDPLNKNDFLFLKIDSDFDFENELKLNSKTLIKKYLELKLQNIDYEEELNTLKIILESLNDNFVKDNLNINYNNKTLGFSFDEIDNKELIKLLDVGICNENNEKMSIYDLEYHDVIILQLKLIQNIIILNDKPIFLLIDCYLDEYLLNEILSLDTKDSIILINTNKKHKIKHLDDYLLVNNYVYDMFDDVTLYHLIDKMNMFISDDNALKEIIVNYINGSNDSKVIELLDII